jgi:hypothetical protein
VNLAQIAINAKKKPENLFSGFNEKLAATYSRRSYTTTTIGHAVFDGRVRNGNGSDHRGIATKNLKKIVPEADSAIL